jgi:dUTP pyrophosphatase
VFREVRDVAALPASVRGTGGYGSTGGHATLERPVDVGSALGTED